MHDLYIQHLTLSTGHTRRSYRSEVRDDVVTYCRDLIDQAIAGEEEGLRVPIPSLGCDLGVVSTSRSLLVSVQREEVPLVTFGLATHSRSGASLWRVLTEVGASTPIHETVKLCPPEPWCAVRLEPGATLADHDVLMALGDFERCMAWAFIERAEETH